MIAEAPQSDGNKAPTGLNMKYVWTISAVAALGGLLFGYDWVVIGGAAKFYEAFFRLTDTAAIVAADATVGQRIWANALSPVGWAQSCALLGCLAGALLAGTLSDRFGRKPVLIAAAANFVVSSLGIAFVGTFGGFIAWRILGGLSIGLASAVSPMYISEVAPAEKRGLLVAVNQLTIVIGILAAQFANWLIARPVPAGLSPEQFALSWNATTGWRWMFAACAVPAAVFLAGSFFVPESPRWLSKAGREARALEVLSRMGGEGYALRAAGEIKATLGGDAEKARFRELFSRRMTPILLFGCLLAVLQQFSGINVIFNYAGEIFTRAGFDMNDTLTSIVATGSVNFLFTFVALFLVDRLGRKPLMIFGFGGLAAIYLAIGWAYRLKEAGSALSPYLFLALVLAAIATYAMSLAPVTWVLISEIFPNRIRGAAMSVAVGSLWLACFILTYTFPILKTIVGTSSTFWIYAGICAFGLVMMAAFLRETKGKTLEQIERERTA
ncbi:MAG: sugar porter family MFS transporter [Candidatus Aminicenantes bacterium]|nr:sugar porter family MFS transporter [Candidatus Aminicenantes bacterium]